MRNPSCGTPFQVTPTTRQRFDPFSISLFSTPFLFRRHHATTMKIPYQLARPLLVAGLTWSTCAFVQNPLRTAWAPYRGTRVLAMSSSTVSATLPSWSDLVQQSSTTAAGKALNDEVALRKKGEGSAARENTLRMFGRDGEPVVTLYRYVDGVPITCS